MSVLMARTDKFRNRIEIILNDYNFKKFLTVFTIYAGSSGF